MKTQWAAVTTHWWSIRVPPHRCPYVFLFPRNIKSSTCQGHEPSSACSPPTIRDNGFRSPQLLFGTVETAAGKNKETRQITDDAQLFILRWQILQKVGDLFRSSRVQRIPYDVRHFPNQWYQNQQKQYRWKTIFEWNELKIAYMWNLDEGSALLTLSSVHAFFSWTAFNNFYLNWVQQQLIHAWRSSSWCLCLAGQIFLKTTAIWICSLHLFLFNDGIN